MRRPSEPEMEKNRKREITAVLLMLLPLLAFSGCGPAVPIVTDVLLVPRGAKEAWSSDVNFHVTVDLQAKPEQYELLAVEKLDNQMLEAMPLYHYDYLNEQIVGAIENRKLFPEVRLFEYEEELEPLQDAPKTLIFEGSVENYHSGHRTLRAVELGLNNAAVTIRFRLKDRASGEVVGAATISVYERAGHAAVEDGMQKVAESVAEFLAGRGPKGKNRQSVASQPQTGPREASK